MAALQVIDASAMVAALVDAGPDGRWAERRLLAGDLIAPHLMPFEVANVLRRLSATGLVESADAAAALDDLADLPIELVPFSALSDRVWQLRSTLTAYDASYVAAAELLDASLVTLDERLQRSPGPRCTIVVPPTPG